LSNLSENINRINAKLQQLLKQYQLMQKENEQLTQSIKELKTAQEANMLRIIQMEQQAGILKSAAGKMNEKDKKIFEQQINQYIKEIDKSIGLLSE
jgi:CHASE3 domain sensor protein